jgi:hypothetical protein
MLAQGMTDQAMLFFKLADQMIRGRQNGKPMNEILIQSITEYQQQQAEAAQAAQQQQAGAQGGGPPGAPGGPDSIDGVGPDGLPPNVAPGQAGLAPGGLPDIQSLVSGFRNGSAEMSSSVRKRIPTG